MLAASLSLIVFAVSLRGTFIYDDFQVFNDDPRFHHPGDWGKYWTDSYNGGVDNLYRPLVSMTYALQWLIHGDSHAWPYHLVNWLLHAAVASLVAETARRSLLITSTSHEQRATTVAIIAGVLFAVHPLHVEAVANIVGRAELMCAAGVFGALVLVLHRPMTLARAFAITGCAALAVLSKEQGLLLPIFIALAAVLIVRPPALLRPALDLPREKERHGWIVLTLNLCWTFAAYIIFREHILKFSWDRGFLDISINPLVRQDADRFLIPIAIAGRYAALLVAPLRLSPDYGGSVIGYRARANDPYLLIGFAAITIVVITLIVLSWRWIRRRTPEVAAALFCLLAAMLAYGMISNILFLIGTNFGERLIYLPSAFLAILIAIALSTFPKSALVPIMIVLTLAMSFKTIAYAKHWNDRSTFYSWASVEQPRSVRLHMLVVADRLSSGDLDGAAAAAKLGRESLPDYDEVWIQSADVAIERGRIAEARAWIDQAMKLRASAKAVGRLVLIGTREAATTRASTAATTR